jgi:hypothetical protein
MNKDLANRLGDSIIEIGKKFKAGTSEISEEEAIDLVQLVAHLQISREEVCQEMNINNNKFYDLINLKKIPAGRKRRGFKELYWWKDEIREAIKKLRKRD